MHVVDDVNVANTKSINIKSLYIKLEKKTNVIYELDRMKIVARNVSYHQWQLCTEYWFSFELDSH